MSRFAFRGAVLAGLLVIPLLLLLLMPKISSFGSQASKGPRLVYILPADNPGPSLCKVIISGMATGFPSPVVINWKEDYRQRHLGGSHLMKISGTLRYLETMLLETTHPDDRLHDDDLVVLVDAYDIWLQLPPSVLIERYHTSNRIANERLAQQWTAKREMPMKQTIIASVQKRCWPGADLPFQTECDKVPQSTARKDLYGDKTDEPLGILSLGNVYHNQRPRFYNSGTIIGPARDMLRYLRRTQERMAMILIKHPELSSDQGVFSEIFADQEVWRTEARKFNNAETLQDERDLAMAAEDFEFHVGLDYTQQLFIPTVFEEEDGDIIALNDAASIAQHSASLGISPVRLKGVPEDVLRAANPLARVTDKDKETADWGEMPMYADFFSEAIPVVVHHNAHRGGLKERRVWWWDRMWYFPYLRQFVHNYLNDYKFQPLARVAVGQDGAETTYWPLPSERHKRMPRMFKPENATEGLPEMAWDVLCPGTEEEEKKRTWYDEVFRDGKGPLPA
ncbi:hypothetical protein B0I35DRAFT_452651 [Stachybotrys elegans]|uniref:Uncharacterized protein n=1 Tax=Stachybotrys elegans TaxID=80388 RepID=A0A8K0WN00_9HYPO|nr:hypothetical protein B0I35DRAFT_452651 [Stachybotrys elegans]